MSPAVIASLISSAATLSSVGLASWIQTRRIDTQNRTALGEQTTEIKEHLKGDASDHR